VDAWERTNPPYEVPQSKKAEQYLATKATLAFTSNAEDAETSTPLVAEAVGRHHHGHHRPDRPLAMGQMSAPPMPSKCAASRTGGWGHRPLSLAQLLNGRGR
jgi:hypothetical protein